MEKIIVRKDVLTLNYGCVGSSLIMLTRGKKYSNEQKLIKDFGFKEVMKKLFNEDVDGDNLSESTLYQLYSEILTMEKDKDKCYKENNKFIELYKVNDEFAMQLDFNIHLYHLVPQKDFYMQMVPWYYADSKKYIGDTWGEKDEEIIDSIQNLSFIDFLKRYKGY